MLRISKNEIEEIRISGCDSSIIAIAESWYALGFRADELISQIDQAFEGVCLHDGMGLWESDGIDNYAGSDELQRLRKGDEKVDWRLIPASDLNYCHVAPSFLDSQGLYFHAPAMMTSELRGDYQHAFIDRLVYGSFTVSGFVNLLSPDQRYVIIAYISFFGSIEHYQFDRDEISKAILRFAMI